MGTPKVCKSYKTPDGWDAVTKTTNGLAKLINRVTKKKVGEDFIKNYTTIYKEYRACIKTRSKVDCWIYAHDYIARKTLRAVSLEAIKGADKNKNCVKDDNERIPVKKTLRTFFDRLKLNVTKMKALYRRLIKKKR